MWEKSHRQNCQSQLKEIQSLVCMLINWQHLKVLKRGLLTIPLGTLLLGMSFRLINQATSKDFWEHWVLPRPPVRQQTPPGWWKNTLFPSASHPNKLAPHSLRFCKFSETAHNTLAFEWLQRLNAGRPVLWKVILIPSAFMCEEPRKTEFLYLLFHHGWVDKHMEGASQFCRPTNMNNILRAEKQLKKLQINFILYSSSCSCLCKAIKSSTLILFFFHEKY